MNLEQLIEQLEVEEQTEFETLVSESQAGGDSKAIRGRLARLVIGVLKRLGETPNPGPFIGQFNRLYAADNGPEPVKLDLPGLSAIDQYPYPLAMAWQAVEAEFTSGLYSDQARSLVGIGRRRTFIGRGFSSEARRFAIGQ